MISFFTQSTIARFHEARHAALKQSTITSMMTEPTPMQAHPHPTTLSSFCRESHIYRLHEDRHHGVIHATSPASTAPTLTMGRDIASLFYDMATTSTIARRHAARHAMLGNPSSQAIQ